MCLDPRLRFQTHVLSLSLSLSLTTIIDFQRQNSLFMNSACTVHALFMNLKILKIGPTTPFTHLKINFTIVFSVFSLSERFPQI